MAEENGQRVRRIGPDGIITTVAGTGTFGYSGDGGPATEAQIATPRRIDVDGTGNVYIAQGQYKVVRRVDPSGIITTVAGGGDGTITNGDGGPATEAHLDFPHDVDVDAAGNMYIADNGGNVPSAIRRVDTAGIITTVAGGGAPTDGLGDGGPATAAALRSANGVAVDATGGLYIADSGHQRIRRVDGAGVITTVASNGQYDLEGDGGPPGDAQFRDPRGIEVHEALGLLIADQFTTGYARWRPSLTS